MLVISRRMGQSLLVGDDVRLTVLGATGNRVRIGISAPREVAVWREELRERSNPRLVARTEWHFGKRRNRPG